MNEVSEMEPILPSGRNFDYREFGWPISFNPYRPLAYFESVRNRSYRKKIILDVGENGFTASPKQLVENYAALGMHFDELIIFEPYIDGMENIPDIYRQTMNITFYNQYVEMFTRNVNTDLISWLIANVQKDDSLVLKFDVDEGSKCPTKEWAFLSDLLDLKALSLVDELYIELHFKNDPIG